MRQVVGAILLLLGMVVVSQPASAGGYYGGYHYSSTYAPGYSFYGAGYYGGQYYPSGYYYAPYQYSYAQYIPFIAVQPVLATTYAPSQPAPVQQLTKSEPCAEHLKQYDARIKAMEEDNKKLREMLLNRPTGANPPRQETPSGAAPERGGQPTPPPGTQPQPAQQPAAAARAQLNGLTVMRNRCAKCHDSNIDVETEGGSFALFADGKMAQLTDKQWVKMNKKISKGEMPPTRLGEASLSQEEGQAILEYLNRVKVVSK